LIQINDQAACRGAYVVMRQNMFALIASVGCALASLGVLVVDDVRLAMRADPTAQIIEHGRETTSIRGSGLSLLTAR
jgi:hypothetical protein